MLDKVKTRLTKPIKRLFRTPFADASSKKLIIHCSQHKVGGTWFGQILRAIADHYGLNFQNCEQEDLRQNTDIFFQHHSRIQVSTLPPYTGSHMIRDPRDIIVSAYFYHRWTTEDWAHQPKAEYGQRSYQDYLNSLDEEEGIIAEIDRSAPNIGIIANWNYSDPNFLEIKYEDMIADEEAGFHRIFKHYGFSPEAIRHCLGVAEQFSFKKVTGRKLGQVNERSHLRSGKPEQWREYFTEKQKKHFKKVLGDVVVKCGYEPNNDW